MQLIVKLTFHDTLSSASVCVYMYLDVMSDITKHCLYFLYSVCKLERR